MSLVLVCRAPQPEGLAGGLLVAFGVDVEPTLLPHWRVTKPETRAQNSFMHLG